MMVNYLQDNSSDIVLYVNIKYVWAWDELE